MEVVRLVDSVLTKVEKVRNMIKEDKKLGVDLKIGLQSVKCDMALLCAKVKKISEQKIEKPEEWMLLLQDLAYDIEDFIDLRRRDRRESAPVRLIHIAMVTDPRPEHIARIQDFKDRIKTIQSWWKDEDPATHEEAQATSPTQKGGGNGRASASPVAPVRDEPLGIGEPKKELRKLLLEADGHQKQLKVISIVGCSGSGKTTLAREVYNDKDVVKRFPAGHRAFVDASFCNQAESILHNILQQVRPAESILRNILQQVRRGAGTSKTTSDVEQGAGTSQKTTGVDQLTSYLQEFLRDKRYLVVIDGVQLAGVWSGIKAAFLDKETGSRVVVSTSIQSVATYCSSGSSYIYAMRGLCKTDSEDLFWAKLGREYRPPVLEDGLETLFDKCDGLPRALVRTAEFLSQQGAPFEKFRDVGVEFGKHLAGNEPAFRELKSALVQCYDGLADHEQKTCMLSLSTFPKGHLINSKSLLRRWKAEGLVVGDVELDEDHVARNCLNKLADLGIIEPVLSGNNSKVKRYRVHGVMLEYIVQRSVSWNFITLIREGMGESRDRVVQNDCTVCAARRLSVHGFRRAAQDGGAAPDGIPMAMGAQDARTCNLARIRSLTICNSKPMNLEGYELLRVLDLEGCSWLTDARLGIICELLYLKYLSLRNTRVSKLPKGMKHLHCLETLDVRQTMVEILTMEVLMLPQLAHLFGEFELPAELADAKRADKLKEFFSQESKLQTLAGFKIVKNRGFEQILLHARKLRKVYIWCKVPTAAAAPPPPPTRPSTKLVTSFNKFIGKTITTNRQENVPNLADSLVASLQRRFTGLDSLSVDFDGLCKDFLSSVLKAASTLTSIKIRGEMESFSESYFSSGMPRNIRELHLSNIGLHCRDLSKLQSLPCLVCLKLAEEDRQDIWDDNFHVATDGFRSLHQLYFHGPNLPSVQIDQGGMRPLISLQLICPEPENELGVTGITHLEHLNEVILHPAASDRKLEAWKKAAIEHKNRPYVERQKNNDRA